MSADRLAEELDPGGGVSAHALQSQVSRLRTALGPAAAIERAGAGYRIVVAPEDVDACRFERLATASPSSWSPVTAPSPRCSTATTGSSLTYRERTWPPRSPARPPRTSRCATTTSSPGAK
ncbi:AfsR/SARP family transcriptional regulator [Streptomyces milbemycinicus]|uniref:OmpR/PhoB-type domain-containing protein n=1 Tax=Streptomyces milbemycinicus TaxID=476552 RepID=A0ABW8LZ46_9ACTN